MSNYVFIQKWAGFALAVLFLVNNILKKRRAWYEYVRRKCIVKGLNTGFLPMVSFYH